ncbi:uncharacterized protein LOC120110992 [Phoenix dactylifera]|uniref:Uncharacterized protein LOC120110992 n=1 Tax=Phoenix dactylifera TaxID=42345 RepID=A0A8B9A939_PHODC|nr:uncharacterized protein LOC120110992 [Phoenix dactylifera]
MLWLFELLELKLHQLMLQRNGILRMLLPFFRETVPQIFLFKAFLDTLEQGSKTKSDRQINDDTLNQLGQNACLGLQLAGHNQYQSDGLNLICEKKFKPRAEVKLQEANLDFQMNGFELPRPRYDASIQIWTSTCGPCGLPVFAKNSYPQVPSCFLGMHAQVDC